MQVRKLVGCVWMTLLSLCFVDVSSGWQMTGCQFSPEGLHHGGDLTTHKPSWLPSPSSSSLMKFASICRRAVFSVLEATLMHFMKSCKGNFSYNQSMNKFCVNDGLHTYLFQALCEQCIFAC